MALSLFQSDLRSMQYAENAAVRPYTAELIDIHVIMYVHSCNRLVKDNLLCRS